MQFSANLGFLWTDLALTDAVGAAAAAGFSAVEVHWPFATPPQTLARACTTAGVPLLALNTARGGAAEFGLSALPGRGAEARAAIDLALDYSVAAGAGAVHVMAGCAEGTEAEAAFRTALTYACNRAAPGVQVWIEPINRHDIPGYFLCDPDQTARLVADLACPNLAVMLDLYHLGRMGLDPAATLRRLAPVLGHVQIAGVPDRGPPGAGTLDVPAIRSALDAIGWTRPLGAEYRPPGTTGDSLSWRTDWD